MSRKYTNGTGRRGWIAAAFLAAGAFLAAAFGKALFRYRWQLLPLFVAAPLPVLGWIAALTLWLWPGWTLAAFGVAGGCAAVWVWQGLQRRYDRMLGAVVAALTLAWVLAVAVNPAAGALYGLWLLGWPILGLFWWCAPAFRSGKALAGLRLRWGNVAELAGIAKAKLLRARDTEVGQVLTVELPGDKTQREVSKERLEAAFGARPGSIHVVRDDTHARRVTIHKVDRDPWANDAVQPHPVLAVLDLLSPPADQNRDDDDLPEVA